MCISEPKASYTALSTQCSITTMAGSGTPQAIGPSKHPYWGFLRHLQQRNPQFLKCSKHSLRSKVWVVDIRNIQTIENFYESLFEPN